ncbi:MAG: GIY-YIG nuclease family protein [Bacteroidetes bacterium]|nr:GIY-YIG nuclease family protein [Bacteroidota bacterium]
MFTVYVLYSEKYKKNYIGYTSNLIERFKSHNVLGTKGYTIRYRPWKVLHTEVFETQNEAMLREKQLKSGQGREWINEFLVPLYMSVGFISA